MSNDIKQWKSLVSEAYNGVLQLNQVVKKGQTEYSAEAEQLNYAPEYPQYKTVADLLHLLDMYVDSAIDGVKNPAAQSVFNKIKNMAPEQSALNLDRLAKTPAPAPGQA